MRNRAAGVGLSLRAAVRDAGELRGWDWSRLRTRGDPKGWNYTEILNGFVSEAKRALDVGTGGGEVFSQVARPGDVALDISLEMLGVARERLSCHLVAGNRAALPFGEGWFDLVADRHG